MKTCKKCGESKPLSAFYINTEMADDHYSLCKECWREKTDKWVEDNPEAAKAISAKSVANNKEAINARNAKWRKENPEIMRALTAKWRKKNPEAVKAANDKFRKENPGYSAEWWKNNSERAEAYKVEARRKYQIDIYGKVLSDPLLTHKDRFRHAKAYGYRSGLEVKIAGELTEAGIAFEYEPYAIKYHQPAKTRRYTPDFVLPNGIIIETKGHFLTADRQKHLMLKVSCPDLQIHFIFSNPGALIGKRSKTTYARWCDKHGFKWAKAVTKAQLRAGKSSIPKEWLNGT